MAAVRLAYWGLFDFGLTFFPIFFIAFVRIYLQNPDPILLGPPPEIFFFVTALCSGTLGQLFYVVIRRVPLLSKGDRVREFKLILSIGTLFIFTIVSVCLYVALLAHTYSLTKFLDLGPLFIHVQVSFTVAAFTLCAAVQALIATFEQ